MRVQPATLEEIDKRLKTKRGSVLHFSCHGADVAGRPTQAMHLEGGGRLDTTTLSGLDSVRKALEEQVPLVVINACEVGRPKPSLVGASGFAQTFVELGAAGVVAALWSVRDDLAHEVTMDFYETIRSNPDLPYAEVLQKIRAQAHKKEEGAEDTYAAYCFYGDPLATAAQ